MKFTELLLPSRTKKNKIIAAIFCLMVFLSGCSEEAGKMTEEKKSPELDNNKSKSEAVLMPKALHDDLMSEEEARFQGLMRINQSVQAERDKLLAEFDALKLTLATTQEELERIITEAAEYKTSSQAAVSGKSAANAQTIHQLTASNSQLSKDLATSKQRAGQLELSVSRMQNPANMLKIRQLTLEKTYLSKELAGRDQKIQELQTSPNSLKHQENLNTIRQLKSKNTVLSQSLARNEKRLKDQQALQNKPRNQVDPYLIKQLQSQNAKLSTERDKLKQQLAKLATRPKDNVKTLAEWKIKLRNQGLMNILPSPAQLAASIGKPHDKEDQIPSGDGDETIFIWHDLVKVNLEIQTIDGKIKTITHDK